MTNAPTPEFQPHEQLTDDHREALIQAASAIIVRRETTGAVAYSTVQLYWHEAEFTGNQQPVALVDFESKPEESSIRTVLRPTLGAFAELHASYPAVREHYPRIYAETTVPHEETTQSLLILEKIEGLHGDNHRSSGDNQAFHEHIANPDNFEQLCQDMFQVADDLLHEPLNLWDISPATGHNIMFDTQAQRYRIFDVDTLETSRKPYAQKFINFLEPCQKIRSNHEATYILRMLQLHTERYPETDLAYESVEYTKTNYTVIDKPSDYPPEEVLSIESSGEDYQVAYTNAVDWRGAAYGSDFPEIHRQRRTGRDHYRLSTSVLQAVETNDVALLEDFLNSNRGRLTESTFVETPAWDPTVEPYR